jgi:neutral trehalase
MGKNKWEIPVEWKPLTPLIKYFIENGNKTTNQLTISRSYEAKMFHILCEDRVCLDKKDLYAPVKPNTYLLRGLCSLVVDEEQKEDFLI